MNTAEEFRKQADQAIERAQSAETRGQGARERRRADGLRQLADNEDWLDGRTAAGSAPEAE